MTDEVSTAEVMAALAALGEVGTSVYSARKLKDGTIVLDLVGRSEPVEYKPPSKPKARARPKSVATAKKKETP
jgi:hypothetical protein